MPNQTGDIIGGVINVVGNITAMIKDAMPSNEVIRLNKAYHQLKRRKYRGVSIENYVAVNFADQSDEKKKEFIEYLRGQLGR
jgi:hypothetical protein